MGTDLKARNKKLGRLHFGGGSWGWMLNAGVGLPIGTGPSMNPAEFYYSHDKLGRCPHYNDGYYVTAEQARMMAMAAWGLAAVMRFINKQWADLSDDERKRREEQNKRYKIYQTPVRQDYIDKVLEFAAWAEKSKGFGIF